MKRLIALPVALLVTMAPAQLAPSNPTAWVSFGWTASPSPGVNNYNVYFGTASGAYTGKQPMGNVLTGTVTNLPRGFTYYFAVTSSDTNGLESIFATPELSWSAPNPPLPVTNQQITGGHH